MPGSFPLNDVRERWRPPFWLPAPLVLIALVTAILAPALTTAQEASFSPSWYMVLDRANLLDEVQERSAIDDAWRLNTIGTPTQVVTELARSTPELASQRAHELRIANGIETAPGSDDGVLVYAVVNPGDRSIVQVTISTGVNALPRGGFTTESVDHIRSGIIEPQLQAGHPARAIVYSLREMHYLQIFTPPPVEPLQGWKSAMHSIMPFAAPVLAALAAAWLVVRVQSVTNLRAAFVPLAFASGIVLVISVVSVLTHSTPGILSALMLAAVTVFLAVRIDQSRPLIGGRTLTVTPRPQGQMRPLSRTTLR